MDGPDPLSEIEFLARSANRIETLAVLSEGAYTRRELGEEVDASQPTLGRVLRDLSKRDWITYDGERYAATATGELVAEGIVDLHERLAVEGKLRPIVEYLPTDAMDVDLRHLADATVTTPTGTRPNAPLERMLDLLRDTEQVRLVSHSFNRGKLDLLHERVIDGEMTARGVFTESAIDAVRSDPDLRVRFDAILDADPQAIRVTDDEVPLALELTDDRVHLLLRDDEGIVRAALDTGDAVVWEWAEGVFERFWTPAEPLVDRLD